MQHRDGIGPIRNTMEEAMVANARQVGAAHYQSEVQHWDYVAANNLGYMEGQITKYVTRWHKKNGLQDLEKALHFLEKLIENVGLSQYGGTNAANVKDFSHD